MKKYIIGVGVLLSAVLFVHTAQANPFFFVQTVQSAVATTSPTWLVPGVATSTIIFDSYAQGQPKATDKGVLLLQTAASSTSSVFSVNVQFSQGYSNTGAATDCVNNPTVCDWYSDNTIATTTITNIAVANGYIFSAAGTPTTTKAVSLTFPTRYIRIIISVAGANGNVWGQIVPQRQSN